MASFLLSFYMESLYFIQVSKDERGEHTTVDKEICVCLPLLRHQGSVLDTLCH